MVDPKLFFNILHAQAWQRAKGELNAMLEASVTEDQSDMERFLKKKAMVEAFIEAFEEEGYHRE